MDVEKRSNENTWQCSTSDLTDAVASMQTSYAASIVVSKPTLQKHNLDLSCSSFGGCQ